MEMGPPPNAEMWLLVNNRMLATNAVPPHLWSRQVKAVNKINIKKHYTWHYLLLILLLS